MEVNNYPMKARNKAELAKLSEVQEQREIEIEELQVTLPPSVYLSV